MNAEMIKTYQQWADREYVTALTCKNHPYHQLLPLQDGAGIVLVCPRGDTRRELGKSEYLEIQRKVLMAEYLWRIR